MEERQYYSAREFCQHHHIEISFLYSLQEYGLLDVPEKAQDLLLTPEQLETLEKLVRLHYDLHINLEGLDAIHHLLNRVEDLQQEVLSLRARLRLHEDNI